MAKKPVEEPLEPQRLYLLTPQLSEADSFLPQLEAALSAGDVACVLLRSASPDEGTIKKLVKALLPVVQKHDAALLVEGDPAVATRSGADGVHLRVTSESDEEKVEDAIERLKPDRIVGTGGIKTKHDSMTIGEMDVDYIMFGDPAPDGWVPPLEQVSERASWWTEIFTIPCVAFAPRLEDVATLAQAGADFIALGDVIWSDTRGPAAATRDAQAALVR